MSLINNMLKDLEKRKTLPAPVPFVAYAKEKTSPIELLARGNKLYIIAAGVIVTLCILFFIKNLLHSKKITSTFVNESTNNINTATTKPAKPTNNEAEWLAPVTISGATLQVKDNITELSFMLSHPAFYRLNSDGMSNQFSFIIEHSKFQAELPISSYLNTAIQHITTESINGSTRFNITLFPGASIKYVNLHSDANNPELVISIEYQPQAQKNKNAMVAAFKSPIMRSVLLQEYQRALHAANEGDYQTAIKNLSAILTADPDYKDARVSLVALMMDQGSAVKATKIINDGLHLTSNYAPFIELKARLLTQNGKVDSALTLLQSISPSLNENPEYHALIAALYARNNKDLLASQLYQQLVQVDSHNSSWWFGLAVSLDKLNQRQAAIEAYTKATSEGHLNGEALAYLQNRLQLLKEDSNVKG